MRPSDSSCSSGSSETLSGSLKDLEVELPILASQSSPEAVSSEHLSEGIKTAASDSRATMSA